MMTLAAIRSRTFAFVAFVTATAVSTLGCSSGASEAPAGPDGSHGPETPGGGAARTEPQGPEGPEGPQGPQELAHLEGVSQLAVAGDRLFAIVGGGSGAPSRLWTMRSDGTELRELPPLDCKNIVGGKNEAICANGSRVSVLTRDGAIYDTPGTYGYSYAKDSLGAFHLARSGDVAFVGTWDRLRTSTVYALARGATGRLEPEETADSFGCRGIAVDGLSVFTLEFGNPFVNERQTTKVVVRSRSGAATRWLADAGPAAYSIVVTSTHVLWWDETSRSVMAIGKSGDGEPVVVRSGIDNTMRAEGDRVYWTAGDALYRADADGSGAMLLAEHASVVAPAFDEKYVYYAYDDAVFRVGK